MNEGKKIPEKLKKILSDNKSGSALLLLKLNSFVISHYPTGAVPSHIIKEIKTAFTPFQNIINYLNELQKLKGFEERKEFFMEFSSGEKVKYELLYSRAYPLLKKHNRIITISNSRTVFEILKRLGKAEKGLTVIVTESRPVNEGRIIAGLLAKEKIKVEFITEAMLPEFLEGCGCALIGADKILPNGDILNKTGSRALAILCRHYKKPFYAAAERSKISSSSKIRKEIKNPAEVWNNPPAGVKVKNYYFETVEKKYIKKIITG